MGIRPQNSNDWRSLSDEEVRDVGQDFGAHVSVVAQVEITRRLIEALREFKTASERAASRLEILTGVLVVFTVVIAWLTYQL